MPDHETAAGFGPFVGRAELLGTATRMLDDSVRWLTLHGPGGVGKTSLAARIAAVWQRSSGGRAWTISLEVLSHESGVFSEHLYALVAKAVGLRSNGTITATTVRDHFDHLELPEVLLVFDRCDDILLPLRPLLADLLRTIPGLKIIATSRERFRRDTGHVLDVTPLTLGESVALFSALVTRAGAGDALTGKAAVKQLCEKLDGLPLAIELAARWVPGGLSVEDLIEQLGKDRFRLLTDPDQDEEFGACSGHDLGGEPALSSGLERAVAFSYGRCSAEERTTWRQLTVFRHGFDVPAAEAVTGLDGMAIREMIAALAYKSIIKKDTDPNTAGTRWLMMDTLRDYGLRELGPAGAAQGRLLHRHHFAGIAEQAADSWYGPHEIDVMHNLHQQLNDVFAAIDYCLDEGDVVGAAMIAFNVVRSRTPHFYGVLDMVAQVLRRVIEAFGIPDTDEKAAVLATIAGALGWVVVTQGRADEAAAMAQFAKDQLARRGMPIPATLMYPLGAIEALRSGSRAAIGLLAGARMATPLVPATMGDRHMMTMVETMSRSWSDTPDEALAIAAEYLRQAEESGGPWSIAWALWGSALAARHAGQLERARRCMLQCLRLEQDINDPWGILWSVELYAWIMAAMLDTAEDSRTAAELAAWLLGASDALRTSMGVDINGLGPLAAARAQAEDQIRRHLSAAEYARPYEAGRHRHADAISVALGETTPRRAASSGVSQQASTLSALYGLSAREEKVAHLVAEGLKNAEIAALMTVSPETVKKQVSSILRKLGAKTRTAVASRVAHSRVDAAPRTARSVGHGAQIP